jgi:hypothetical protein
MKLKFGLNVVSVGLVAALGAVAILACGEEAPGNNGPSEEYFPATAGDVWTYETYNLATDPTRQHPLYTRVSINNLVRTPGAPPTPTLVTSYAKNDLGHALRFRNEGQGHYWQDQDFCFRYDYYEYGSDWYLVNGYYYLSFYRDPIIGTYYYDEGEQKEPFYLFKTPMNVGDEWDVLNKNNPNPVSNPTTYRHVSQKDYFGLARDMDGDNALDDMDISITAKVEWRALLNTALGQFNCYKVVHTQTLVFHLSDTGDVEDVSKTTYWFAENYGIMKSVSYEGSDYLDSLEMVISNVWFLK